MRLDTTLLLLFLVGLFWVFVSSLGPLLGGGGSACRYGTHPPYMRNACGPAERPTWSEGHNTGLGGDGPIEGRLGVRP